jgi:hypothetical protein
MWNHIRSPPYAGQDGKRMQIIMPQFQAQFAIESQIVAFLYALSTLALMVLYTRVPGSGKQRILGLGALAAFVIIFNFGISIFRHKGMGYPFSFLF